MNVRLKVVEGKPLGASIPLTGPDFLIGRHPACQLRPKHESVGERHCALRVEAGRVAVLDLGSAGGTLLNGRRLDPAEPAPAMHGDRLRVGNLVFEVAIAPPPAAPADEEEDEDENSPAAIANRLIQRSLGAGPDPTRAVGTRLRTELVEGVPVVLVDMARIDDEAAALPLRKELRNLAERPALARVILDLRKVRSLGPAAAEVLADFHGRLRARGVALKLCDVAPAVLRVLQREGLTDRVAIGFDCRDAIWSSW
jgi:anti-anti-sigma factor